MKHLFSSESPVVLLPGSPSDNTARYAYSTPFTVWDAMSGGTNVTTQLTSSDGVSAYVAVTNGVGEVPLPFRGPDGSPDGPTLLWLDIGADQRTPIRAVDITLIDGVQVDARLDALEAAQGTGGGLPEGTNLDGIPDGRSRFALTQALADKINQASTVQLGTAHNTAMYGDTTFSAVQVGAVPNPGGTITSMVYRTKAQGLPVSVVDGQIVLLANS